MSDPFVPGLAESYYDDSSWPVSPDEKRANARRRQTRSYAAALARLHDPDCREVARALRSCEPGDRCACGACPDCIIGTSRQFQDTCWSLADAALRNILAVSIVPSDTTAIVRNLADADITRIRDSLAERLARAGYGRMPFVAGLDVAFKVDDRIGDSHWALHWYGFTADRDPGTLSSDLRKVFQRSERVRVPIQVKVVNRTPDRAFAYGLKARFEWQRVGEAKRRRGTIGPGHLKFGELMVFLHRVGLSDRVYLQNLNLVPQH